jgi:hypothetical protein
MCLNSQTLPKMLQHLQYQISFIKLSMKYVLLVHLFKLVDVDT